MAVLRFFYFERQRRKKDVFIMVLYRSLDRCYCRHCNHVPDANFKKREGGLIVNDL